MPVKTRRARKRVLTMKRFIHKLSEIYPKCKHDISNCKEDYKDHTITYGEMEYDGIQKLYAYVCKKHPRIDSFIDVGSGRGKLCMFMAAQSKIKRCVGDA